MGQRDVNDQLTQQMYECIKTSVSEEVRKRMVTERASYQFNGEPDGPSYLMTLIQVYFTKTEDTPNQIKREINIRNPFVFKHISNLKVMIFLEGVFHFEIFRVLE